MSSFSSETKFTKIVSEEIATPRSRHTSRRRRIPMLASPRRRARCDRRAVTATKHEPGLWPACRVVSNGSAMEVWVLWMRLLSHYQRARGEVFAVVPLLRAAFSCWLSVVRREAAAKLCVSLCSTEQPSQIQNQSFFHATQRTGSTDKPLLSRPQKISSPLASASPLARQLYRCSIGFPHAWLTTFCNPEHPDALATTPHSLR